MIRINSRNAWMVDHAPVARARALIAKEDTGMHEPGTNKNRFAAIGTKKRHWVALILVGAILLFAARAAFGSATQYRWQPELSPTGPMVVLVRLDRQQLYVYRNGVAIGSSRISSGRAGYETPTGIFTILQKDRDHRSNRYDNAPMPHMVRLTWDGVALHGGALPGHPASHGCIRLPPEFAELLFAVTRRGDTVVVADAEVATDALGSGWLAPVTAKGLPQPVPVEPLSAWWDDTQQEPGALSIVVNLLARRVHVLRNGVRIAESTLDVDPGFVFEGSVIYVRLQPVGDAAHAPATPRWASYSMDATVVPSIDELAAALHAPADFTNRVALAITPGTTLVLSTALDRAWDLTPPVTDVLESGAETR